MFFWHVPAPNEALLISGSKRNNEATQFRIVTGHGCFVTPVKQKARVLSLALREAEIVEECITSQAWIAKAHADQAAAERELAAAAMKAQFERDTAIKRAKFLAETDQAQAVAAHPGRGRAGPGQVRRRGGLSILDTLRKSAPVTGNGVTSNGVVRHAALAEENVVLAQ